MAPRSFAGRAALVLGCAAFAACTAPSFAPNSQNANVPARVPVPQPTATALYGTTGQYPGIYRCYDAPCNGCKPIGSGNDGIITWGDISTGSVYVVNQNTHQVLQLNYKCNVTKTYPNFGYAGYDVGVASSGMVAVTNEYSTPFSGKGNIRFYPRNGKSYYATGLFENFLFGAFDAHGNFYNDGIEPNGGTGIGVVPAGSKVDRSAGISGVTTPEGMQIGHNGDLNVIDLHCKCIRVYRGKSHVLDVTLGDAVKPISLALNQANTLVWVTDTSAGKVEAYRYPKGGRAVTVLTGFSTAFGVGILPASEP
jgi:hypothetical protein